MSKKAENTPTVSVIVAIYNRWEWVRLVLDALRSQRSAPSFEVVLADDGSSPETVAAIRDYATAHPDLRLVHSHIEDLGWRKNISLNQAIRRSSGDLLIFVDGDCIPHPRFVADHLALAHPGCVVGGRRVEMTQRMSDSTALLPELPSRFFGRLRLQALREIFGSQARRALSALGRTIRMPLLLRRFFVSRYGGFIGCNFSIFRSDLEAVNGFDERYLAPATGEDSDLSVRLQNNGVRVLKTSHYALMAHRCHPELPRDSAENARLLQEAISRRLTRIPTGLHRR